MQSPLVFYPPGSGGGGTATASPEVAVSVSNGSFLFSTLSLGNLNGLSFYSSNGSVVGSYTVPNQTAFVFSNSNGVTFGTNGSTVTASHNGLTSQSNQAVSGSNGSFSFETISFGNLNGVSFYTSNGSLVASYTVPTQTVQTQNMVSVQGSTGNISFSNANGITFGANASTITASHNALTSQSNQAVSANNGSSTFQTLSLANSNGISFSTGTQGIYASHNGLTTARASNDGIGLNTAKTNVTWTVNSSGISLDAGGYAGTNSTFNGTNISGSITQNSNGLRLDLSVAPGGGGADGYNILAAGTQTASSTGTVVLSNSNNVSFGMTNNSIITASASFNQSVQTQGLQGASAGTTSLTSGTLNFLNSGGISWGLNGSNLTGVVGAVRVITANGSSVSDVKTLQFDNSNGLTFGLSTGAGIGTITASHNGLTSQSNQAVSGSNGSFTFQTLSFNNANGISFGSNGSAITASYTVPTVTNSSLTLSDGNTSLSIARLAFTNSNGISLSLSTTTGGSATLVGSHNGITSQTVQTQNMVSIQGSTNNISFGNANGITFGANASTITASHNAITSQSVQTQSNVQGLSAGTQVARTGDVALVNSNGITFGMSNSSQITASYTVPTVTNSSWTVSDANTSLTIGQLAFTNSNGLTMGLSTTTGGKATVTGSYTVPSTAGLLSAINFSAGTTSNNLSKLTFSDSNGVSFGLNGSVVTATVKTDYQSQGAYLTTARASNDAIGLNTAFTNVTATVNSSGLSINASGYAGTNSTFNGTNISGSITQNSAGLRIDLSVNPGGGGGVAVANSQTTYSSGTANLLEGGGAITIASTTGQKFNISVPQTSSLQGYGNITISTTGSTVAISASSLGDGYNLLAAGTQTANSTGTVAFSNSNGITFGMSNSSVITASHNGLTQQSTQPVAVSGQNGSYAFSTLSFSNANGISFGTSAGNALTASHNAITSQSVQTQNMVSVNGSTGNISLATGSSLSSSSNGSTITFGLASNITTALQSAGAYLTTAMQSNTPIVQSINGSSGTFSFMTASSLSSSRNGNSISFGLASNITTALQSAGAYLTTARASNDAIGLNTAQSNVTWTANSAGLSLDARGYAGTATGATNASVTANSNGVSVSVGNYLTTAMASNRGTDFVQANAAFAGTNASGTIASNGISVSVNAGGASPTASASNGSFTFNTIGFSNANNVTFGTSAGSIITASVAAPGAAAENNWFNLSGNTAGNSTASGSTINLSAVNLTLSGTNGSQIAISAPATSSLSATGAVSLSTNGSTISIGVPSPVTVSRYNEFKESPKVAGQIGNASLHIQPWLIPNLHMDRVVQHIQVSNASNSSGSFTVSNWIGIYTRTSNTLSLLHSASTSFNFSGSGTVGSYSLYGGARQLTLGLTQTLTEGQYWVGVVSRTTTGGAAGQTINQLLNSNINSTLSGQIGLATNASYQWTLGLGRYSATTSGMPSSIAFTQIDGNSSIFLRPPSIYFVNGTV